VIIFDQERQYRTGNFRSSAICDALFIIACAQCQVVGEAAQRNILPRDCEPNAQLNRSADYLTEELETARVAERYLPRAPHVNRQQRENLTRLW
jgi:hypothetical protein